MNRLLKLLFSFYILLVFQGCYTILQRPKPTLYVPTPAERELYYFNSTAYSSNQDLFGGWSHSQLWIDGGEEIKKIYFDPDGKIHFYPNSIDPNAGYIEGEYRTYSDTLFIHFMDSNILEKYTFVTGNGNLFLKSLDATKSEQYKLNPSLIHYWVKEIN